MIIYVDRGAYWDCKEAQLIFNPVSITRGKIGKEVFNKVIKEKYPNVFEDYLSSVNFISKRRLIGDIDLIQIDDTKFIMNAFVYEEDKILLRPLVKALLEMNNLMEEYNISGSLRSTFGSKDKSIYNDLKKIIYTIFNDNSQNIYVFEPSSKKLHR